VGPVRTELLEPGGWTIDAVYSFVTFTVEHFTVSYARGLAAGPTGRIVIGQQLLDSSVDATIDATTVTTGNAARDAKIHGPDVLDVERFPTIEFQSTRLRDLGDGQFRLDGNLVLHGVTRPVTLALSFNGVVTDTWGKARLGMTATTTLLRDQFGAGAWGHAALAMGGFMVPHAVKVVIDIEATEDTGSP